MEATTPRVLRDGRPRRTLYEVGASITRKWMGIVAAGVGATGCLGMVE